MENDDKSTAGCLTAIFVAVFVPVGLICGFAGIDSTFLVMLICFGVFGVVLALFALIYSAYEKRERKKAAKRVLQQNIENRERILAGNEQPEYALLKPISVKDSSNYEEQSLITAFNNYIPLINKSLEVEQYNQFVKNQQSTLIKLNNALDYEPYADFDKLPQAKTNTFSLDLKKVYISSNFDKMYKFFVQNTEWNDFISYVTKIKLDDDSKLFCDNVNSKYTGFFNGYDINAIRLDNDDYLFFFPCYIIHLNNNALSVIAYDDMTLNIRFIEKKCTEIYFGNFIREELVKENGRTKIYYINKVRQLELKWKNNQRTFTCKQTDSFITHYNYFLKSLKSKANAEFFEKTFAIDEETQRQNLEDARSKVISCKKPAKYKVLDCPDLLEKYSNKEETKINKSFIDFIAFKNENLKIKQFNEFIDKSKEELRSLNTELGYIEDKDFDKLPSTKKPETSKNGGYLNKSFIQLYDYFNLKKEWKKFIFGAQKCENATEKNLINSAIESIYKEFFKKYDINAISLGGDSYLLLFPCYIVYIQKSMVLKVIPYEKMKIELEYEDKKSKTKNAPNGKIVAQEYTHQNLDGSPNRRYKSNPIIYTVRYFSLRFSWSHKTHSISCKDAELFLELFNDYAKSFKDELNVYIFKNVFAKDDEVDIENIISDYKEKEKKEKEKIKKQAELAEKKRLQEEQAKEEEEKQRKLAIIQRQKERNEEMLRKKELERNAMKLFGEDITDDYEGSFDSGSEVSTNTQTTVALSVLSECLITNNVFKVELRQEIDAVEQEYGIVFVDSNKTPISNERVIKKVAVGEKIITGITLLPNIDFTTMKKCFMQIEANGEVIAEIPFRMNIAFYSDF